MLNTDYTFGSGTKALAEGAADAIGFGRAFTANPDLPYRFAHGVPLAPDHVATWYSQESTGYVDYETAQADGVTTSWV